MLKNFVLILITNLSLFFSSCSKKEAPFIMPQEFEVNVFDAITGEPLDLEEFRHFTHNQKHSIDMNGSNTISSAKIFEDLNNIHGAQFLKEGYFPMLGHSFTRDEVNFDNFEVPMKKLTQVKLKVKYPKPVKSYHIEISHQIGLRECHSTGRFDEDCNHFYSQEILEIQEVSPNESFVYIPSIPEEDLKVTIWYNYTDATSGPQIRKDILTDATDVFELDVQLD